MLEFEPATILFTVINLLVLYLILRKLLFGRVNAVLEQRSALVKGEIAAAEGDLYGMKGSKNSKRRR